MPMFIGKRLFDLELGRRQYRAWRSFRKIYLGGFPTLVAQQTSRSLASRRNIADQLHVRRVEPLDFGERAFDSIDHRLEAHVSGQGFASLRLDVAHRRADLVVGERADVFHQKVDQARVALQDREDLDSAIGGTGNGFGFGRGGRSGSRFCGHCPGVSESLSDVGWKLASEEDGEKTTERERDSVQNLASIENARVRATLLFYP